MKSEVYARAMFELKSSGKSADYIVNGTIASLKKRGALKLLPKILNAYKSLIERMNTKEATLTIARDQDRETVLKDSKAPEDIKIKIDANLIGGYRLESEGKLIDNSFKSRLLQMYREVLAR